MLVGSMKKLTAPARRTANEKMKMSDICCEEEGALMFMVMSQNDKARLVGDVERWCSVVGGTMDGCHLIYCVTDVVQS